MAEGGKKMRVDDLFITEDISVLDAMRKLDETGLGLSLIHISEPTRLGMISYAVFCLKKKKRRERRKKNH